MMKIFKPVTALVDLFLNKTQVNAGDVFVGSEGVSSYKVHIVKVDDMDITYRPEGCIGTCRLDRKTFLSYYKKY